MRWLAAVALAALLSGCTTPTDEPAKDPLFGLCPQWVQGPGSTALTLQLAGNESADREVGPANSTIDGRPLDLFRIRLDKLTVDGVLELRAFGADGHQLGIRDYRQTGGQQLVPVVVFRDGAAAGHEFDVFLSPVAHGSVGSPAPVTLRWMPSDGSAMVEASVTYHYKVCGAEL
jgi:hypothetical protein